MTVVHRFRPICEYHETDGYPFASMMPTPTGEYVLATDVLKFLVEVKARDEHGYEIEDLIDTALLDFAAQRETNAK